MRVPATVFPLFSLIGALSISGCAQGLAGQLGRAPAEPTDDPGLSLSAAYAQLEAQGGKAMALDPQASTVRIYVFRAGEAASLGHNHVLSAPRFEGRFYRPTKGLAAARFDLEFRLDQLEFDAPAHRAALGPAFSSLVTPEAIEATRNNMLGPDNMQADRFPFVRIRSRAVAGEAPLAAAKIAVELHGEQREMWIPLRVEGLPNRVQATGSLVLRQSDFGIKPYTVLGGLLAVQDEVVIEFSLVGM